MRLSRWALALTAALLATTASAAPRYELVDLGAFNGGGASDALAINNTDEIVGYGTLLNRHVLPVRFAKGRALRLFPRDGVSYHGGSAVAISDAGHATGQAFVGHRRTAIFVAQGDNITLYTPTEGGAVAKGINSLGQVAGWHALPTQADRPSVMQDGQWQDLPVPESGLPGYAWAINDLGQVVGQVQQTVNGEVQQQAALWQDGALKQTFGLPGSPTSLALAINRQGWVTGYSQVGRRYYKVHAYIHRDGVTTDLETRLGAHSYGHGINAAGEVIGDRAVGGHYGPFLFSGGRMWWLARLLPPEQQSQWQLLSVHGINDAGNIVGSARNAQGRQRAVLLRRLNAPAAAP